jgi:hypothetical protein
MTNKNSMTKIEPVSRTPPVGVVYLFYFTRSEMISIDGFVLWDLFCNPLFHA